jgi:outer membrane receptor protein involved in Fe transport
MMKPVIYCCATLALTVSTISSVSAQQQTQPSERRQIEEIVVTAEKVQSTVSDTSISITAFDTRMIRDFGIQGADELANFVPATTRDEYDIRVRGVGRNFRALGGDPGVATYYNGIYSPDFNIAASENALYDIERVEVLRGPQGTLYGRNSVGGAINYITRRPTQYFEGEVRSLVGSFDAREFYGVLSGPLVADRLAARASFVKRDRDGAQPGLGASPDAEGIDDRNLVLALLWDVTDSFSWYVRNNDRESDRVYSAPIFITEGPAPLRHVRSVDIPVFGLTTRDDTVTANTPGAMAFTNPLTSQTVWATYNRPGLDPNGWPHQPNAAFGRGLSDVVPAGGKATSPPRKVQYNKSPGSCTKFPYTECESNHEYFGHHAISSDMTWDMSDRMQVKYLYGYQSFDYTYNQDLDHTNSEHSKYRQTVLESVRSYSNELQLFWPLGTNWTATSGLYMFREVRDQDYSLSNRTARYTQPATYGALDTRVTWLPGNCGAGGCSIADYYFADGVPNGGHARLYSAAVGTSNFGRWLGDPRGDVYVHENKVHNEAYAAYTQGTYRFNEQFALVLGLRYARDKKAAREVRGGYYEDPLPWAMGFIGFIPGGTFPINGLTPLGAINVTAGNATATGDPNNPLQPNCPIDAAACATPLRLGEGMPGSFSSNVAGSDSWSDVNYRLNLDWTPNDDMLMYFSVTTGYRAGGFQLGIADARDQQRDPETGLPIPGSDILPMTYDKETIRSFEIGYKGFHFNRTLQISSSIYQYNYKGYQDWIDAYDPIRGRSVDVVQNAGRAVNRGFELDGFWLATNQLSLGGNYSYTDAFYDVDYFLIDTANPLYPLSIFGPVVEGNPNNAFLMHNVKGDQLKRIPKHKATAWGMYEIPTAAGDFTLRTSYAYTGKYANSGIDSAFNTVPARRRIDMSVNWVDPGANWYVRLFVDNVTNDDPVRSLGAGTESSNWALTGSALYPRFWGLDVRYAFRR